jgi:hypothetical protein
MASQRRINMELGVTLKELRESGQCNSHLQYCTSLLHEALSPTMPAPYRKAARTSYMCYDSHDLHSTYWLAPLDPTGVRAISLGPVGENLFQWELFFAGPEETPYAEAAFRLRIDFPSDYPFKAGPWISFPRGRGRFASKRKFCFCVEHVLSAWVRGSELEVTGWADCEA